MNTHSLPTALLISSSCSDKLLEHAQNLVASQFCERRTTKRTYSCSTCSCSTCSCTTCDKIRMQQYHATLWLSPENQYLISDIEPVIKTTFLKLPDNEHFFFIFQHAERLSAASGNRLLKTIEEPPERYHFIFLTTNPNEVLPTIRSRCIHETIEGKAHSINGKEIIDAFTTELKSLSLHNFSQLLRSLEIDHIQSRTIFDQLMRIFLSLYKKAVKEVSVKAYFYEATLALIKDAQKRPPLPGSHELFWKSLYLSFVVIRKKYKNL